MKKKLQKNTLFCLLFLSIGITSWGQNLFTQDTLTVCSQDSYDMVSPFPSNFNVWKKTGEEEVIVSSTMTFRSSGWYHLYTSSTGVNDVSVCQVFNLSNSYSASLNVPLGHQITSLQIALWGTPNVNCSNPTPSSCNVNVTSIINRSLVGKTNFTYYSGDFPDPCTGTQKYLYAKYTCTPYIHDSIYVNIIPTQTLNVPDFVSCNNLNQEITLNPLSCDTTFQLIQTLTQSSNNTTQSTLSLDKGQLYRLKVSNTISFGGGAGNQNDAAYSNYPLTPIADIFWRFNGYQPGPLPQFRPIPDGYNSNHIYYFYFLGDGTPQDIGNYDCCLGDDSGFISIDVEKVIINANCGLSYLLNNVSINNVFQVAPSNQINHLYISNGAVKCLIDSFYVYPRLSQNLDLGQDTIRICGTNTTLSTNNPASSTYLWNTGATTATLDIISSGEYSVTVTDSLGCSSSDSILVSVINPTIIAGASAFCLGDSTTLSVQTKGNTCNIYPNNLLDGLTGWWTFCGNANDESGNGHQGINNGATLTNDRFESVNRGYQFDGVNDFIKVNNIYDYSNKTINTWFNAAEIYKTGNSAYQIFDIDAQSLSYGRTSAQIESGILYVTGGGELASYAIPIDSNQWYMLTMTRTPTVIKYYLNGSYLGESPSGISTSTTNDNPNLLIGVDRAETVQFFKGKIDEVGIWNRDLSAQEIAQLFYHGNLNTWWSDGTTNQSSIQAQPSQTTTYSVTASDGVGTCTDSITIQVNNPQINAGSDLSVCEGETATLTATGADTYVWGNGVVNGQPFTPTVDGYYTVTGTDTLGCSNTVSVFLDVLQPTSSTISPVSCDTYTAPDNEVYTNSGQYTAIIPNTTGCDSTITINLTINNSNSGIDSKTACDSYTWIDGNTYTESTNSSTFTLQNVSGCDSVVTLNLTINKLQTLNGGEDQSVCKGENVILTASGAETYSWNSGVSDGIAFSPSLGSTTYTVTGTDGNGCTDSDEVIVTSEYCFEIPGALSPNSDNNNDTWEITGLQNYPNALISVFDRWGQKVYEGSSASTPWDGKYNGKDLPTADYYYVIELGNGDKYNGVVTLKR
jgi:gliding motility-associated-like protein